MSAGREVQIPQHFETFYREHFRPVVALVYSLSGSRWAAEDIAQDVFLQAHRDWDRIGRFDSPAGWVRTVAVNAARSRFRRLGAETRALRRWFGMQPTAFPEVEAPFDEFWAEVRRLPKRQAQVIALHYLSDMSVADIAAALGIAESTVKSSLAKGRASLATRLEHRGVPS